jgi:hypothetical protein
VPGFAALNERFERSPQSFYPSWHGSNHAAFLLQELEAMKRSISWRITAPLRRPRRFLVR